MAGRHPGGIAAATALLADYGGAIEADLQRHYGVHLGDFPWPLTARRLRVLLQWLPSGSAYALALEANPPRPPVDPAKQKRTAAALERRGIRIPDELRGR